MKGALNEVTRDRNKVSAELDLSATISAANGATSEEQLAMNAGLGSTPFYGSGARFVHLDTIAILVSSYHRHFSEYSKTKRQVVQRVPGKVWKQVYADYKAEMEAEFRKAGYDFNERRLPAERTLQDALRAALDPFTGASDRASATRIAPLSKGVRIALGEPDGHARKDMLRHRDAIITGTKNANTGCADDAHEQGTVSNEICVERGPVPDPRPEAISVAVVDENIVKGLVNESGLSDQIPLGTASRKSNSFYNAERLEKLSISIRELTESASTLGASLRSIAKTFEAREQVRRESETLAIRRARLEEVKFLLENDIITRAEFVERIKNITD